MKNFKKNGLLLLAGTMLLAACQGRNASSSASSSEGSSESSDSSSSSSVVPSNLITYAKLQEKMALLKGASSYALSYTENGESLQDVYTDKYVYFGWQGGGYVTLDAYDKAQFGGDTLAYEYAYYSDESVEILSAQSYNGTYVHSASEYNYMPLWGEGNFVAKENDFVYQDDALYTENQNLVYLFALAMGYNVDSLDSAFTGVGFSLTDADALSFSLYYQPDTDSEFTDVLVTATFQDVGNAGIAALDSYFASYTMPNVALSEETGKGLKASTVSLTSEISLASTNSTSWSELGEGQVDSYKDQDASKDRTRVYINDTINKEAHEYIFAKGSDGVKAVETYVDGTNALKEVEKENIRWGSEVFTVQDEVDLSGFREVSAGNYHYFGGNAENILESMTHFFVSTDMILSGVRGINLQVSADGALTFVMETNAIFYNSDGEQTLYRVRVVSSLEKTPRLFDLPASFDPTSEEAKGNQAIFDKLKGEESYQASGYTVKKDGTKGTQTFTLTFIKDKALIVDTTDGSSQRRTVKGYKMTEEGVVPFNVTLSLDKTSSTLKATDKAQAGKTLGDYVPFEASGAVFTKDGSALTPKSGVKEIGKYIFGGYRKEWLLEPTLSMLLDGSGRLSKITYDYVAYNLLTGKEAVEIVYAEQALPSYIAEADFNALVGSEANASWQDEEASLYAIMKKTYGDKVNEIPYLYDATFANTWHTGIYYDASEKDAFYVYTGSKQDVLPYLDKYVAYITSEEVGFVEQTIDGRTYYVKDGIGIRVVKEAGNGYDIGLSFRVIA